jgi:hypothetical protein
MNAKSLTLGRAVKWALISAFVSILSGWVPGEVIDVVPGSEDCHTGCLAAAAGWPLAYIVDGHGLSPHGSADFIGLMFGIDRLDVPRAGLNWLLWLSVLASISAACTLWRNRKT